MRFAGFDVSTQGCKLVVIDVARGEVVHADSLRYDDDLPAYGTRNGIVPELGEGAAESDPRMWVDAVEVLLGRLRDSIDPAGVRCISVSAQMHGLVLLDDGGALARPRAKLWNDVTTAPECALLTEAVGGPEAMIAATGNSQRPGYTASKILHVRRHEPEVWQRTATVLVVHNWVNAMLTGGVAAMEPGDASGTALWNPRKGDWAPELLAAVGDDLAAKLPPVRPSTATIGCVDATLARRFGLAPDCRIDAGCGDNMYGALGCGSVAGGPVTVSLGTSGTAALVVDRPWIDPAGEIACYHDSTGRYLSLLCVSNMANGYNALRHELEIGHQQFEALVQATPPGNDGRIVLPWYEGERTPDLPLGTGLWFGFAVDELGAANRARAVLEGQLQALRSGFRRMPGNAGALRVTGGLSASPAWLQTLADVFGRDAVPVAGEAAAMGAAIHAAWVWQREQSAGASAAPADGIAAPAAAGEDDGDDDANLGRLVERFVALDGSRRVRPRPELCAIYDVQRRLYQALADRVRGIEADDPLRLRRELKETAARSVVS